STKDSMSGAGTEIISMPEMYCLSRYALCQTRASSKKSTYRCEKRERGFWSEGEGSPNGPPKERSPRYRRSCEETSHLQPPSSNLPCPETEHKKMNKRVVVASSLAIYARPTQQLPVPAPAAARPPMLQDDTAQIGFQTHPFSTNPAPLLSP
ncbi:1777_t:CDS:2, partial [Acaulospora colombiana]